MSNLWLMDFRWPAADAAVSNAAEAELGLWQSIDGVAGRVYSNAAASPGANWDLLVVLNLVEGASVGADAAFHYVVETDVAPEHERELNAWYDEEHLPGLVGVPGTVRAARYRRASGSPRYLVCYDLTTPVTLERPEWLAVRHTDWSSRVRPLFDNTRRTMFTRLTNKR